MVKRFTTLSDSSADCSSFQKPFAEAMLGTPSQLHVVTDRQTVNAHGQYKPCQPLGDQYFLAIAATKAGGVPQL